MARQRDSQPAPGYSAPPSAATQTIASLLGGPPLPSDDAVGNEAAVETEADEITRLRAENKALRQRQRPHAEVAAELSGGRWQDPTGPPAAPAPAKTKPRRVPPVVGDRAAPFCYEGTLPGDLICGVPVRFFSHAEHPADAAAEYLRHAGVIKTGHKVRVVRLTAEDVAESDAVADEKCRAEVARLRAGGGHVKLRDQLVHAPDSP